MALSRVGAVLRQDFDFCQIAQEAPAIRFGDAVRCLVAIQESGLMSLMICCKGLRAGHDAIRALEKRIIETYGHAASFCKASHLGRPTFAAAKRILGMLDSPLASGHTRLTHWLVQQGPLMAVEVPGLIKHGANVNACTPQGTPALIVAAGAGNMLTVRLLLDAKARVNAKSPLGATALMVATTAGHTEIVTLLLDRGADRGEKSGTANEFDEMKGGPCDNG
jgi:hypothetical protein